MNRLRNLTIRVAAWLLLAAAAVAQTSIDLRTQTKGVDFSAASSTRPTRTGSSLPPTCAVGEFYFKTDASAGNNLFGCTSSNLWTVMGAQTNNTTVFPNYSKAFTSATTVSITGAEHGLGTPNLLVICYDNSIPAALIEPDRTQVHPTTFEVTIRFSQSQTGRCVVSGISATGAGGGSGAVYSVFGRVGGIVGQAGDYSFPQIGGTITDSQIGVGVSAGKIGAGSVSNTAFGYLANVSSDLQAQMNGKAAANHSHATGGDLSGDVSNTTVTRVQNLAVAATTPADGQVMTWSQLNGRWQPGTVTSGSSGGGAPTGPASGSLSGSYPSPTIVSSGVAPGTYGSASQIPQFTVNAEGRITSAAAVPLQGGATAGGATMASQLGDFNVQSTNAQVLTIGSGCTNSTPCNFRFGNTAYSVASSATATLGAGSSGTAYIYLSGDGALNVGHNMTVTCSSGCVATSGLTGFPPNTIPLFTWTALNSAWDTAGGRDNRAFLSAKTVSNGTGLISVESGSQTTFSVDAAVVPTYLMSSSAVAFPAMGNGACATELTLSLPGANPGDSVAAGWPPDLPNGVIGMMRVSAVNTVGVRLCNLSGATVAAGTSTFRATVVRSF